MLPDGVDVVFAGACDEGHGRQIFLHSITPAVNGERVVHTLDAKHRRLWKIHTVHVI